MPSQKSAMNTSKIRVNTKIYPLDVIYSASYVFLDRAYIRLDGDPRKEITVSITPKKSDIRNLDKEFQNELLSYSLHKVQSEKNSAVREAIIQRALLTAESAPEAKPVDIPEFKEADADFIEDPEGIAIPWEEKFGGKKDGKKA